MFTLSGLIEIELNTAAVTVKSAAPDTDARLAVSVLSPTPVPVASPVLPAVLLTFAIDGAEEFHCAKLVTSWLLPSLNVPCALNCWLKPTATDPLAGETVIVCSPGAGL